MQSFLDMLLSKGVAIPAGCVTALMAFALGRLSRRDQARQEALGKRQMEDLLAIRDIVHTAAQQIRAAVAYARSSGVLQTERLAHELDGLGATIVTHARSLPARQGDRIHDLLVRLEGDSGVRMAEQMGLAYRQTEPYANAVTGVPVPESARDGWCTEFIRRGGDVSCGLLCLHDDDPQDLLLVRLDQAVPVLEDLLRQVGGRTYLARRTPREFFAGIWPRPRALPTPRPPDPERAGSGDRGGDA
ncbi:hypothetical protein [Streptomyces bacillaris]|uniref:hypothetical protein n=1 Tax=Streptomyces bacillaris TaxID=68179 RepID=UPI0034616FDD